MAKNALLPVEKFKSSDLVGIGESFFGVQTAGPRAKKQDKQDKPVASEAKTALADALKKTADAGGFRFTGRATAAESMFPGLPTSLEGELEGSVDARKHVHAALRSDSADYAVYRVGEQIAERMSWTGEAADIGRTPDVLLSLLDLEHVRGRVEGAATVTEEPEQTIGGVKCRVFRTSLKAGAIRRAREGANRGMVIGGMAKISGVDLDVAVGKDDGLVRTLTATVKHSLQNVIIRRMGGGGDDEDQEEGRESKATTTLTLSDHGTKAEVAIPEELKRKLEK